jgi:hypothetical protein
MSRELQDKLRFLEEDFLGQPALARQADLREMNRIRRELGMPLVDEKLREILAERPAPPALVVAPTSTSVDHAEGREIYQLYLKKLTELKPHQEYATRVAKATAGRGMTPVKPLATMGTNGGALLCDYCRKPIILEGGNYNRVPVDEAWKRNPKENWLSFISGGLVVEIQTNGTLRIYHGYPNDPRYCCNKASKERADERDAFDSGSIPDKRAVLLAFLECEFPTMPRNEQLDLLNDISEKLFAYDPGLGINRPGV